MISLEESTHTYHNTDYPNVSYTSVTTVLGMFKDKFDEDFHAQRVAERKGLHKDDVIAEWREMNRAANEYGTALHEICERYLLAPNRMYSPRDEFEKVVINALRDMCESEGLSMIDSKTLKPEHIMSIEFNEEEGVAGTADVIEDIPGKELFNVWDFKTNKKFNYENKYGEFLHFPLDHLVHCQYNDYTIQLSVYALMYERETGKKFNRGGLIYWDKFIKSFKLIPISYMKKEAEMLIEFYKIKKMIQ
mgnify:CR=1 FL=1